MPILSCSSVRAATKLLLVFEAAVELLLLLEVAAAVSVLLSSPAE